MKTFKEILLQEKRKNEKANKERHGAESFIRQLWEDETYYQIYMSLTSVPKLGINPINQYNTPTGIYSYKLSDYIEEIVENGLTDSLPFVPDNTKFVSFFTIKPTKGRVIYTRTYTKANMESDLETLKSFYENQIARFSAKDEDVAKRNEKILDELQRKRKNIVSAIDRVEKEKKIVDLSSIVNEYLTLPSDYKHIKGISSKEITSETEMTELKNRFAETERKIFADDLNSDTENSTTTAILDFIRKLPALSMTKTSGINSSLVPIKKIRKECEKLSNTEKKDFGDDFLSALSDFEKLIKRSHGKNSPLVFANRERAIANLKIIVTALKEIKDLSLKDQELLFRAENDLKNLIQYSSQKIAQNDDSKESETKRLYQMLKKIDVQIGTFNNLFVPSKVFGCKTDDYNLKNFPSFEKLIANAKTYFTDFGEMDDSNYDFSGQAKNFFEVWKASHIVAKILSFPLHTMSVNIWNRILVKVLRISAVVDTYGIIHENEPKQTVFFETSMLKLIKTASFEKNVIVEPDDLRKKRKLEILADFGSSTSLKTLFNRLKGKYRTDDILNNMSSLHYIIDCILSDNRVKAMIKNKNHWLYELYTGQYGKKKKIPERFRAIFNNLWDRKMEKLIA